MEVSFMSFETLLLSKEGAIATIVINRPDVRNALNDQAWKELRRAFEQVRDDAEVRVLVITGAGDKAFAAGTDIRWLHGMSGVERLDPASQVTLNLLESMDKPSIAAVNGFALGGGCEVAMACDIRIAGDQAKLGLPEINIGIIPGSGGSQRLTRLVGAGKAKEMIFTGKIIDAQEAERIGLVQQVVPHDQVLAAARELAGQMIEKAPVALRLAKVAVTAAMNGDLQTGLAVEKLAQSFLFNTADSVEGMSAFLEKRKPQYQGR
jgi:enoyl-CoA hydratase